MSTAVTMIVYDEGHPWMTPDQITAHIVEANELAESGDLVQAESICSLILSERARNLDANHLLSLILTQKGDLKRAQKHAEVAIKAAPNEGYLHYVLGNIKRNRDKPATAIKDYIKAQKYSPEIPDIYYNLALCYQETNQVEKAVSAYKKTIKHDPNFGEAWFNLGLIYQSNDKFEEAHYAYSKAALILSDLPDVYNNLGMVLERQGKIHDAQTMYEKALSINPEFGMSLVNLANVYKHSGDDAKAIELLQKGILADPYNETAGIGLGYILQKNDYYEDAIPIYEKILQFNPDSVEALINLGVSCQSIGNTNKARECYNDALSLVKNDALKINHALCIPVINESIEQINTVRANLFSYLEELESFQVSLTDPNEQVNRTTFHLAYHGKNDLVIHKSLAEFYSQACPKLTYVAPHCKNYQFSGDRKLRIGFVSMHFNAHSIGRVMKSIIAKFDRENFHVTTFDYPHKKDYVSDFIIEHSDKVIKLNNHLFENQKIISDEEIDILFYADIGMDPDTYFLAFARLAPVQCVTWGHPVTTGIENVDYFLSGEYFEPDNAQEHYTEKLICFKNLLTCFEPPEIEDKRTRADFDLSDENNIYLCPQQLFKFHPEFDLVMAEILRKDEMGQIVLVDTKHKYMQSILKKRFEHQIPDVADRIKIVPYPGKVGFLRLMQLADAMLDTHYYGGGVTSLEGLWMNIPIVTLPGDLQRSRHTYGYYKLMNLMDFVAKDTNEYVSIAVRLATEKKYFIESSAKIAEHKEVIFNNEGIISELETFFKTLKQFKSKKPRHC